MQTQTEGGSQFNSNFIRDYSKETTALDRYIPFVQVNAHETQPETLHTSKVYSIHLKCKKHRY